MTNRAATLYTLVLSSSLEDIFSCKQFSVLIRFVIVLATLEACWWWCCQDGVKPEAHIIYSEWMDGMNTNTVEY